MSMFDLTGKVAIVTGAATGLGQGMAIALAEAGADVVSVGLGDHTETAQKIGAAGRKFLAIDADLFSTEPIQGVIDQVVAEFGHLDILVNNAGIIRRADAVDFTEKDWDDVMNINVKTVFFFCQAAAKQFIKQGSGGKIINIASMLSFQGGIRVPSYTASKSGIMGITRLMANEWAKHNINANAIAPGYMATANTAPLRADEGRSAEILSRIPAGRWGTPADLGGPVVFLASSAADYINGYTVAVDGGWLAR
ncbi:MAG: 2-deoxy-D-gluconate 3-dehydrogenase [Sporomusa sp.]|nr:2-deoxy-D-gluconate 3-dehydrogenase [Sporomusa sp.]